MRSNAAGAHWPVPPSHVLSNSLFKEGPLRLMVTVVPVVTLQRTPMLTFTWMLVALQLTNVAGMFQLWQSEQSTQ